MVTVSLPIWPDNLLFLVYGRISGKSNLESGRIPDIKKAGLSDWTSDASLIKNTLF
jgi:hypothetical protein